MSSGGSIPVEIEGEAPVSAPVPAKLAYLDYMEGFRGLAIIFVVMIHANNALLRRGVEGVTDQFSWVYTGFHILSHNSTVYFALISGILYAYCLHRKPHGEFLQSRFSAVVAPYAIVTIFLTLMLFGMAAMRGDGLPASSGMASELAYNLVFGEAWNHLWYIPVITVLYVISPLLLRLAERRELIWAATILTLLPLAVSRTATEVTLAMLVYFSGVYMVGLLIGVNPERTLAQLERFWKWAVFIAVAAACGVAYLDWAGIEFVGPTSVRESAIYVLRIALAVLMLIGLRKFSGRLGPKTDRALKLIAAYSFGIYFLHAPLLRPIVKVVGSFVPDGNPAWALVLAISVTFVLSLALSVAIVAAVKRIAGRHSKLLVGS